MNNVDLGIRVEAGFPPRALLQSKKKISGEISKEPSLDILLTDSEQSSFSLCILPLQTKRFIPLKQPFKAVTRRFYSNRITRFSPIVPSLNRSGRTGVSVIPILQNASQKRLCTPHLKTSCYLFFVLKKRIGKTIPSISKISYLFYSNRKLNLLKPFFIFIRLQPSFSIKQNKTTENINLVTVGDYVHCGDKIGFFYETPIVISESGKILKISPTQMTIQKMQPVLFYSQAEIHVENHEWVKRGTPILTLTHQTLVTGDIVQGIPRIEQLFEASTATPPGAALQDFSSPSDDDFAKKESIHNYLKTNGKNKTFANFLPPSSLRLKETHLLQSGEEKYDLTSPSATEEKPMFLHKTLQSQVRETFRKKWAQSPLPVAVRQSLEEIQQIIVESIQKVYISQGVLIADKHIEIIVRQMTSKAQIFDGGSTGLLIDEILSLQQIENANISTPGQKALYLPVVLGLTRAALRSESFVSAASFQETTRVLSRDAVAGKTDFLRGLKEKVIIGDLIDAGTGLDAFYIYSLFAKKIFENKFREILNRKITHKTLKKLVVNTNK